MRTRNVETQRVAVADVVSDQRQAGVGRWTKASAIATALPNPRRADARRSSECAFLHRKNRFSPANVRTAPGARGVSPPWCGSRLCSGKRNHSAKITRRCRCVFRYHGGLMPAALANVRSCVAKIVFCLQTFALQQERGRQPPVEGTPHASSRARNSPHCRCRRGLHTHGGLTPAALVSVSHGRRTVRDFRGTALGSPDHGGLTPAALVNLRSCTAKIVFWPANVRTATGAGGVSPPWDVLGMRTRNVETQRVAVANAVSDQRQAGVGRWTKASAIATALPNPRRADARRSSECAFLHRKNRFSPANVRTAPGARGVSPPWCGSRLCSGKRNHSAKITRRCRCVFRYHGGLMPTALVNLRSCIAQIVFSPANVRTATRAGGVSPPWDVLGMRTRNVETQRVAVANAVSDQRRANAGRRTKASAIATALPNPRRADTRRSCECAFLHRKNRFFRRQTFALQQERGA
jgi:folate-dependent phosphoribosylglycinamide formyltransferase PurN